MMSYVFSLNLLRSDRPSPPVFFAYMLLVLASFLPLLLVSVERQLSVLHSLPYSKRSLSATLLLALSGVPAGVAALVGLFSASVFPLIVGRTDLQTSWFFLSAAGPCMFLFGSIPFSRLVVLELLWRAFPHARLSVHQILLLQTLLAIAVYLALLVLVPQRSIPGVMLVAGVLFFPLLSLRPDVYAYKLRPMDTAQKPDGVKVSGLPTVFRKPVWSSGGMWVIYMVAAFLAAHLLPHNAIRREVLAIIPFALCAMVAGLLAEYARLYFLSPRAQRQLPMKRSTQAFRLALSLFAVPIPLIVYFVAITYQGVSAFFAQHGLEIRFMVRDMYGKHPAPSPSFLIIPAIALLLTFPFVAVRISPSRRTGIMVVLPLVIYPWSLALDLPAHITAIGFGGPAGSLLVVVAFLLAWFLFWRMLGNSQFYRSRPGSAVK